MGPSLGRWRRLLPDLLASGGVLAMVFGVWVFVLDRGVWSNTERQHRDRESREQQLTQLEEEARHQKHWLGVREDVESFLKTHAFPLKDFDLFRQTMSDRLGRMGARGERFQILPQKEGWLLIRFQLHLSAPYARQKQLLEELARDEHLVVVRQVHMKMDSHRVEGFYTVEACFVR